MTRASQSFTFTSQRGIEQILVSQCGICAGYDPNVTDQSTWPPFMPFMAIWDTGATASVITQEVVNKCGLKPTGMAQVHHADGVSQAETFMVNISLPNNVAFANLRVTKGKLSGGIHALIGMDIISQGDFLVTAKNGKTVFSYRHPSLGAIDFVAEGLETKRIESGAPPKWDPWHKKKKR